MLSKIQNRVKNMTLTEALGVAAVVGIGAYYVYKRSQRAKYQRMIAGWVRAHTTCTAAGVARA